ncbi:MAG: hypothetical protein CMH57_04170 [Myxococcales bacterium]|nr:hypothetical protein [Myxococcales bacterium]
MNWEHVRSLLALVQHGSTHRAARVLGVNRTTVSRHITRLEANLNLPLIHHTDDGWELTEFGGALVGVADRFQLALFDLQAEASAEQQQLAGRVRLSLPQPMLPIVMPALRQLAERFPLIQVELQEQASLAGTLAPDTPLALIVSDAPDPNLVGRRVGPVQCGLYAHEEALARPSPGWIGLDQELRELTLNRWLEQRIAPEDIRIRVGSAAAMLEAVMCGLGIGALPCFMADPVAELRRVHLPLPAPEANLWLLTHPHALKHARVRAIYDGLLDLLIELRPIFKGAQEPTTPFELAPVTTTQELYA